MEAFSIIYTTKKKKINVDRYLDSIKNILIDLKCISHLVFQRIYFCFKFTADFRQQFSFVIYYITWGKFIIIRHWAQKIRTPSKFDTYFCK